MAATPRDIVSCLHFRLISIDTKKIGMRVTIPILPGLQKLWTPARRGTSPSSRPQMVVR